MEENKNAKLIDAEILNELVTMRMPFGKYSGRLLCDLPGPYLEWFNRKGFPAGRIGVLLSVLFEIKLNGLEYLLTPLKNKKNKISKTDS
jgi:uncharacterized protein (DUF3820 family)